MDADEEAYILLLLSDSNLPTGSFVASSGLESHIKHGFGNGNIMTFVQDSLGTYARSALPFVLDAHRLLYHHINSQDCDLEFLVNNLVALEELYDSMTLNHVARRASKAQGVALLTLYTKSFMPPSQSSESLERLAQFFSKYKTLVRAERAHGHLPTCWGVLTAGLGLSAERASYLHLFLHARGLLSAAVRLNKIGPYNAQQLLLHQVRPLVTGEAEHCRGMTTGTVRTAPDLVDSELFEAHRQGSANIWPLGEILAARHDLQHSRIFNS
ncbi:urease accessory protein UreF [Cylindrobasidium torrendii FP15055 ss-10]|uniref:Urease accessory protein UreF n=1 Tax=Cylindrobasidium torrendii FP15055 ss-10 TaxID=1314674 RepID=A0A0D7BUQ5_9AGAR|nr:urease accessory protein UreF [Cylindrobasidium torrendii FP15055 ss-10]